MTKPDKKHLAFKNVIHTYKYFKSFGQVKSKLLLGTMTIKTNIKYSSFEHNNSRHVNYKYDVIRNFPFSINNLVWIWKLDTWSILEEPCCFLTPTCSSLTSKPFIGVTMTVFSISELWGCPDCTHHLMQLFTKNSKCISPWKTLNQHAMAVKQTQQTC